MAKQLCERLGANIMSENYIVINGKKLELTEEQLKKLEIEPARHSKNPTSCLCQHPFKKLSQNTRSNQRRSIKSLTTTECSGNSQNWLENARLR